MLNMAKMKCWKLKRNNSWEVFSKMDYAKMRRTVDNHVGDKYTPKEMNKFGFKKVVRGKC